MQKPDTDLNAAEALRAAEALAEAMGPFFTAMRGVLGTLSKIPWPVAVQYLEEVRSIELSKALGVGPRTVLKADGSGPGPDPDRVRTFSEGLDEIQSRNADVAKLLGLPEHSPWMQLVTELEARLQDARASAQREVIIALYRKPRDKASNGAWAAELCRDFNLDVAATREEAFKQ